MISWNNECEIEDNMFGDDFSVADVKNEVPDVMPSHFSIKKLDIDNVDDIYLLLTDHYKNDGFVKTTYSRDYIYWYHNNICQGLFLGLVYNGKLVGTIAARIIDIVVTGHNIQAAIVEMLCVHSSIRSMGLSKHLISAIKVELNNLGHYTGIFISDVKDEKYFSQMFVYLIPINVTKLKELGFLEEGTHPPRLNNKNNPLHLLQKGDIVDLVPVLNYELSKYKIYQVFTIDTAIKYLLPKKSIVYTFVIKHDEKITDMISFYQNYLYCIRSSRIITVAKLGLYFCTSVTLPELIQHAVDKLYSYGFDQLTYHDNEVAKVKIDVASYESNNVEHAYWHGAKIKLYNNSDIAVII